MSEELKIEIVNPEKSFLVKEDVLEVVVPAFEGEMGILRKFFSKKEQAQLLFDLSKELDEIDTFFENKFNILMGYASKDEIISDENIL